MEINIGKIILDEEVCIGDLELNVVKETPELEDLIVIPSAEEQNFKSEKYGYNNVKVKAIETEELSIMPTNQEQIKEGIFNKVTVAGSENLVADNIKKGVEIFGVKGTGNVTNAKITSGRNLFYSGLRVDYVYELLDLCENITDAYCMFGSTGLKSLDLSNFDTSTITNMGQMFYGNTSLEELNISNFNTSNVTSMGDMFYNCKVLKEIDLSSFDTSKVTNMSNMFRTCKGLSSLNLLNFDMSKVNNIKNMFQDVENLSVLRSFKNLGKGYTQKTQNYSNYTLDLSYMPQLTHESLIDIITIGLYDLNLTYGVANGGTLYAQALILGSTNLAKLSEEEIAIATNKGWNIS